MMHLAGTIEPPLSNASPRVEVLWVDPLNEHPDSPAPIRSLSSEVQGDGSFVLDLFAPPAESAWRSIPVPNTVGEQIVFAFGELVVVDDADMDGTFSVTPDNVVVPPDRYVSTVGNVVVTYVVEAVPTPAVVPDLWPILSGKTGYHLGTINCTMPAVPEVAEVLPSDANVILDRSVPSSVLVYDRSCLRSHTVSATSPTGP
jgi:hypothetical protein